ncbi:hypothetical protein PHYBLDRAFT_169698 [Phycomyces blakesleeanus NRRL 1555(-)]|uniref:Uncharacterized protein n=1 Tax=Phycomyces blakesleeanus (strain ATCC 8743b / DSM 1359 / FGSC 10004 / NBRC 33097 / NRRL 1555) TaxID=763407 RepID=A0A163DNN7_PHYB8|nr:hypothetical protein PHYBLDRAFT_169698 [Phycomyces blakesleeanus NRRL 1555(-)]OAD72570.1 hypothetical protein PHYBLDRAFT_169698 [Phycomyces blakesleeanus NRRL 1555(-)]|eukprot:XP_018290610.1 hypothetical protein PHYBLDRAFT_169698 [Phycomyces blakesleeanus NRRL 1555(-)]
MKNELIELGIAEKPLDNDTNKIIDRRLRCPKGMKDVQLELFKKVKHDPKIMSNLNLVEITTFGKFFFSVFFLGCVFNHYTCRLTDLTVPANVEYVHIDLLPLMASLLSLKTIIDETSALLSQADKDANLRSSLKRSFSKDSNSKISQITCAKCQVTRKQQNQTNKNSRK